MNELKERCGIVGIYGKGLPISRLTFFSLFALQHRGQEASGITTNDGQKFRTHRGRGLVSQVYTEKIIKNLTSVKALQNFLSSKKVLKKNRNDSELITDAIDFYIKSGDTPPKAVKKVFPLITGAFSIVMMNKDTLVAVRDTYEMRPLVLGKIKNGYVVASETCALATISASFLREIKGGEMIVINKKGMKSVQLAKTNPKHDIFEFVYFY